MPLFDRARDFISGGALSAAREAQTEARSTAWHNRNLRDRVTVLESESLTNQDGWTLASGLLSGNYSGLTDAQLKLARGLARRMFHRNVWIKRGVENQVNFVFGLGVEIGSKIEAVNEVVQEFWDDFSNQAELTTPDSLQDKERELQLHGEIYFVFFVNTLTGRVQVRSFDPDTIAGEPICDPDDEKQVWFYRREWSAPVHDAASGATTYQTQIAYHPDWHHNPAFKPETWGGAPIHWDRPVFHLKTGTLKRAKRGVPEVFAQLDWAKVYTEFLANRATVARALSEIIRTVKATTANARNAIAAKLGAARNRPDVERIGQTAVMGEDGEMAPANVKGATIDPKEGRAFVEAIATGFGPPPTYFGLVDVGNHATAASLDLPTKLLFGRRRLFWVGVLQAILFFVLLQAATRPKGKLRGKCRLKWNAQTPQILVKNKKGEEIAAPLDVDFPAYDDGDPKSNLEALAIAQGLIPDPRLIAKKGLQILKEDDVDETLDGMTFPDPNAPQPEKTPVEPPKPAPIDPKKV